jgi:FMN phosphatase YigB (HAD superfamily)
MVGDSLGHDIEGARAVGMHAVWLKRGPRLPDAALDCDVPIISSLSELPSLLHASSTSRTSG